MRPNMSKVPVSVLRLERLDTRVQEARKLAQHLPAPQPDLDRLLDALEGIAHDVGEMEGAVAV